MVSVQEYPQGNALLEKASEVTMTDTLSLTLNLPNSVAKNSWSSVHIIVKYNFITLHAYINHKEIIQQRKKKNIY